MSYSTLNSGLRRRKVADRFGIGVSAVVKGRDASVVRSMTPAQAFVEPFLAPALKPGDVIRGILGAPKGEAARSAICGVGARRAVSAALLAGSQSALVVKIKR